MLSELSCWLLNKVLRSDAWSSCHAASGSQQCAAQMLNSTGCLLQGMGYLVSHDICEFAAHATQHLLDTAPEVSTVNPA